MAKMELTKSEAKKDTIESQENNEPKYPWGLCIQLENESLEKLGLMKYGFEIGDEIKIVGIAKVTSVSEHESMNQEAKKCVSFQITDLECKLESGIEKTAKKVYKEK